MTKQRPPSTTLGWLRKRLWIQVAFIFVWLDPLFLRMHNFCAPVFHCYSCPLATFACPIGVIANFAGLHIFFFVALGTLAVVGAFVGAFICGWVCPFGFLQDLLAKIPTPRFRLPRLAGYLRYVVLAALVLAVPFVWGESHRLFICRVCPAGAIEGALPLVIQSAIAAREAAPSKDASQPAQAQTASPAAEIETASASAQNETASAAQNETASGSDTQSETASNAARIETAAPDAAIPADVAIETATRSAAAAAAIPVSAEEAARKPSTTKLIIAGAFVLLALFTYRPWCVLFCPLGAIYGLTNKFSAMFLKFSPHKCIDCGWCRKLCKYGVEPDRAANDLRCVRCLECTRCGVLTVSNVLKKGD